MEITRELIQKIDDVLARGLSCGLGSRDGQMCVEAALCYALGLPHGDDPGCVEEPVRTFKICLNDSNYWKSPESRAEGMRSLAIAQLGSKGVVDGTRFVKLLTEKTIRRLIPTMLRDLYPKNEKLMAAALRCETEGTHAAARAAADAAADAAAAADARYAAGMAAAAAAAATDARYAAGMAAAAAAAATDAAATAIDPEKYLRLSAELALECLKELGSPGCEWL